VNPSNLKFPTALHEQAAQSAYRFFSPRTEVDSVLVVNSCARGQAVPESDLDMAVLIRPDTSGEDVTRLEALWQQELGADAALIRYRASGNRAHLHLDLTRGQYLPQKWDEGGGPDGFELEIGNHLAYSAPLGAAGSYFRQLQADWLPYYGDDLRRQRLEMARAACAYDLEHVPFYVGRELYFQAFDRLYKAFQEFLQALFIARRVYPLAYNKWIRMQVAEWLELPGLYSELPPVISVRNIASAELLEKADSLNKLLDRWALD
jgi:predicted nucleotidyltransferase